MKDKDYQLWVHGEQGDDFAHHLERAKGDVPRALLWWAARLKRAAELCLDVSAALSPGVGIDPGVEVEGAGHFITLWAKTEIGEQLLAIAAFEQLIQANAVEP